MRTEQEYEKEVSGFFFYPSFWERYIEIPDEKLRSVFLDALCRYGATGEIVPLEWPLDAIFEQCAISIDSAKARYERASHGGKKSSRKIPLSREEVNLKYEELGNLQAVADYYGVSVRTLYNIRNRSEE